jgi:hypothetical protein
MDENAGSFTLFDLRLHEICTTLDRVWQAEGQSKVPAPSTLAIDFSYLGTVLTHAAAVHGPAVNTESVRYDCFLDWGSELTGHENQSSEAWARSGHLGIACPALLRLQLHL